MCIKKVDSEILGCSRNRIYFLENTLVIDLEMRDWIWKDRK